MCGFGKDLSDLSESMGNEIWVTCGEKVNTDHLKSSSKVISKYKCDLTEKL